MPSDAEPIFDCLACGVCCRLAGGVTLRPDDVDRLAAFLGLSTTEFLIRRTSDGRHLLTKGREDPACAFLDGTRCTVYAARPDLCRDYPVGGAQCLHARRLLLPPSSSPPNIDEEAAVLSPALPSLPPALPAPPETPQPQEG